jgi:RNA recognition motif-containing protein
MAKRIYVGNLPFAATSQELESSFAQHGEVLSARIVTDRETGRSKGFAFVEMAEDEAANAAIDALNGAEYLGRTLTVNEARPREDRPAGGGFGGNRGSGGGGGSRGGFGGGRDNGGYGRR